jgi:hypothetical protein
MIKQTTDRKGVFNMKKSVVSLNGYEIVKGQKSGSFLVNGRAVNRGEFVEMVLTEKMFGQVWHKDHIAYNEGSDIDADGIGYSVKSAKASLTEKILRDDMSENSRQSIIAEYLENVASQKFLYGIEISGEMVVYEMDKKEFAEFLQDMWTMDKQSGKNQYKLRIRRADTKVIQYFENLLER